MVWSLGRLSPEARYDFFVLQSQRSFAIPDMWSGILLLGLLGYASNAIFVTVERRILRWHRGAHSSALADGA